MCPVRNAGEGPPRRWACRFRRSGCRRCGCCQRTRRRSSGRRCDYGTELRPVGGCRCLRRRCPPEIIAPEALRAIASFVEGAGRGVVPDRPGIWLCACGSLRRDPPGRGATSLGSTRIGCAEIGHRPVGDSLRLASRRRRKWVTGSSSKEARSVRPAGTARSWRSSIRPDPGTTGSGGATATRASSSRARTHGWRPPVVRAHVCLRLGHRGSRARATSP